MGRWDEPLAHGHCQSHQPHLGQGRSICQRPPAQLCGSPEWRFCGTSLEGKGADVRALSLCLSSLSVGLCLSPWQGFSRQGLGRPHVG